VRTRDLIQVPDKGLEPIDDLQQQEVRPLGDPTTTRSTDPGSQSLPPVVEQSQQLVDESDKPRASLEIHTVGNIGVIQHDPLVRQALQNSHQPRVGESVAVVPVAQETQIEGADFHRGLRLL